MGLRFLTSLSLQFDVLDKVQYVGRFPLANQCMRLSSLIRNLLTLYA